MKKSRIIMISALFAIAFSACTKDDGDATNPLNPNNPLNPSTAGSETVIEAETDLMAKGMPIIDKDNNIYMEFCDIYDNKTTLVCIGANNKKKWSTDISDMAEAIVINNNTIYLAGKHNLYAINATDGSQAWKYTLTDNEVHVSAKTTYKPCIDPSGNIIVAMDSYLTLDLVDAIPARVVSISPSGALNWEYIVTTGDNYNDRYTKLSAPICSKQKIYFAALVTEGLSSMVSYSLDLNGNQNNTISHGELTGGAIACANSNGDLYVQLKDGDNWTGKLVKMTSSLTEIWVKDMPDYMSYNGVIDADENFYVNCEEGNIYKFDSDGNELWKSDIGKVFVRGELALCADGNFYKANQSVECYETKTGKELDISTSYIPGTMLAFKADGTIVFGSNDKVILLPSTSKGIDTNAQWAKYGYDSENSSSIK